jgi:3-hydroxyacyl-CoA dehydrogenase
VIGHPFNPPYLIPLVEVVGGAKTSAESISKAMTFYTDSGKRPIHILKELPGHIANRLQAALWREALYMVDEGVASVADVDAAVSWGPGLRWGVMGPSLTFHLAGGRGGISYFLDHLTGPLRTWWEPLGKAELTPQLISKLIQGVADEAGDRSIEALNLERDRVVMGLLKLRRENPE